MAENTPQLELYQASEVLNKYYQGQIWRAAAPVDTNPEVHDENGNIIAGIEWNENNSIPKPSIEELVSKWQEVEASGEYGQQWDVVPGSGRVDKYFGKMSEYAQKLLESCDWAALPDTNLANQAEWDDYRVALRDIRSNPSASKTFPVRPEVIFA